MGGDFSVKIVCCLLSVVFGFKPIGSVYRVSSRQYASDYRD
jgi:hypothetical protein